MSANLSYKVSQDGNFGIGKEYNRDYPRGERWRTLKRSDVNFTAPDPTLNDVNMKANIKTYLDIKAGFRIFTEKDNVNGDVYVGIKPYSKLLVEIPGSPAWRLSAGMQYCWGYAYKLKFKVLFSFKIEDDDAFCGAEEEFWKKEGGSIGNTRLAMTWSVIEQSGAYVHVGRDAITNPYVGDTSTANTLPVLCLYQDGRSAPGGINFDFDNGWSKGTLAATQPVAGTSLTSLDMANQLCINAFGAGWRIAEFHDGYHGADFSASGGWSYWGEGSLPTNTRFWVHINDQAVNPWN